MLVYHIEPRLRCVCVCVPRQRRGEYVCSTVRTALLSGRAQRTSKRCYLFIRLDCAVVAGLGGDSSLTLAAVFRVVVALMLHIRGHFWLSLARTSTYIFAQSLVVLLRF